LTLPDSIGKLKTLIELYLHENELESLPDSIGQLTALTDLSIYNNKFTELPNSLKSLTSLTNLEVDISHSEDPIVKHWKTSGIYVQFMN